MNKTVKITGSIAIIVLAGVLYYVRSSGSANDLISTEYNALLKCRSCGNEFKAMLNVEESAPYACSKCGKKAAWSMYKCNDCGTVFLPELVGDRPPMAPPCPKCKGISTGAAPSS